MRLYHFPIDLTGNVNMIKKLVLGRTGTGDLPIPHLCSIKSRLSEVETQTVAAGQETKANAQEHYYSDPTYHEPRHAPKEVLIQQTRPSLINGSTEFGNTRSGKHARYAET